VRGFLFGSLLLIALEVAIRNSDNAAASLGFTTKVLTRLLSSQVAGVPDRAGATTAPDAGVQDDGGPAPWAFTPSPNLGAGPATRVNGAVYTA
jgi:hypothetical protein